MKLSEQEVLKIARLAMLDLSAEEAEMYRGQLSGILDYVGKLNELDVEGIEPTAHAVLVETPFREDEPVQSRDLEKSIVNAPDRDGNFFRVPKVIR